MSIADVMVSRHCKKAWSLVQQERKIFPRPKSKAQTHLTYGYCLIPEQAVIANVQQHRLSNKCRSFLNDC